MTLSEVRTAVAAAMTEGATRHLHTRLVQFNGFDQPTRELSEYDALRLGTEVHDEEAEEIAAPEEKRGQRWHYSTEELGVVVADMRDGLSPDATAAKLGRSEKSVKHARTLIRRWMAVQPTRNGKGERRKRRVTPEQEAAIVAFREGGLTVKHIAEGMKLSEGTVRYVLEARRG